MKKAQVVSLFLIVILMALIFSCDKDNSNSVKNKVSNEIIDADDVNIEYIGRFDRSNPKKVVFDWSGVYIRAIFEGTSIAVRLNDGANLYNVSIDDQAPQTLATADPIVYTLATDLVDTTHTILIQKRTEASIGKGEFLGFILDEGKQLVAPSSTPDRRIEFIGNSITCGYGVEGADQNEHFKPETENAGLSYAALVGRALNADYTMVCYSGIGVVRNYGDSNKTSIEPMPAMYDRTCYYNSTLKWDHTSWIPQAVIINLGSNDFSTQPHPEKSVFQEAYKELIHRIQSQYTDVTTFCVTGPIIGEPCSTYIEEVVEQFQQEAQNKEVHFINVGSNLLTMNELGSDCHPNITGQQKTADKVLPVVQEKMNW